MIEYGLLASKSGGFISDLVTFGNDIPFWPAFGGIAAFALLICWLVFKN